MSKILSLKLQEDIFRDTEEIVKKMDIPRNTFINKAVAFYIRAYKKGLLKKQYKDASKAVAYDSMQVLKEFEAFSQDFE